MGKRWRKIRRRVEEELLCDAEIEIWATTDIHNEATRLRAQAFEHKVKFARKAEPDPVKMARVLAEYMATSGGPIGEAAGMQVVPRALRQTAARSFTRSSSSFGTPQSTSASSSANTSSRQTPTTSVSSGSKPYSFVFGNAEEAKGGRKAESPVRPPSPDLPYRVIKGKRKAESPPRPLSPVSSTPIHVPKGKRRAVSPLRLPSPVVPTRVIRSLPRGRVKKETPFVSWFIFSCVAS